LFGNWLSVPRVGEQPVAPRQRERRHIRPVLAGLLQELHGPTVYAAEGVPFAEGFERLGIVLVLLDGFAGLGQQGVELAVTGGAGEIAKLKHLVPAS
jgi:hypothetical protein